MPLTCERCGSTWPTPLAARKHAAICKGMVCEIEPEEAQQRQHNEDSVSNGGSQVETGALSYFGLEADDESTAPAAAEETPRQRPVAQLQRRVAPEIGYGRPEMNQ